MILEDLKHELQKLDLAAFYHRSDEEWLNEEQSSLHENVSLGHVVRHVVKRRLRPWTGRCL